MPESFTQLIEQLIRRDKEKSSRYRRAEVQQTIRIAYGITDEHILQHSSGGAERAGIGDKIGTVFTFGGMGEWHVGTDYFQIVSDVRHGVMGVLRFFLI